MANVKTAVSLQAPLFQKVEEMAAEMKITRSRLFTLAIEQFIRTYEKERMREALNRVYANGIDPEDRLLLEGMRRRQRKLLEKTGEEW
jgi:metal-responsive CopG/Arc/MetJ family transcriptional regulator